MKITDLLSKDAIKLNGIANSKQDAINKLVDLMAKNGNLTDKEKYTQVVLKREEEGSTGIGEGIAIPHGKTDAVSKPGLSAMVINDGVEFDSLDGQPAKLLFLIAAPNTKDNVHLDVLSRLSTLLMDTEFRKSLMEAKTPEEFLRYIDIAENAKLSQTKKNDEYEILAITSCPTGIAHTYMAAEALEKMGEQLGHKVKVETHGSSGVKNKFTKEEIKNAKAVIIAADTKIDLSRFDGKKLIKAKVADGINRPQELIERVLSSDAKIYHSSNKSQNSDSDEKEGFGTKIYKHLMNGVTHMLPFVVGGGILIAIAFLLDDYSINPSNFGMNTPVAAFFKTVGGAAFNVMLYILAGYIAMSIADRPGLAVGFVGGILAVQGTTFASLTDSSVVLVSSGFLGALIAGFVGGYIVILLKKICSYLPDSIEGIKTILLYPVFGILLMGAFMLLINPYVGAINTAINNYLSSMGTANKVVLGAILGGMMAIDLGGPINKAAYTFGTGMLASGQYEIMAAVMAGGMVPPLAIAFLATAFPKKISKKDKQAAYVNYIMGLSFISEGAIPFASADPLRTLPAFVVGSAVTGALSMIFNCTLMAPHGGIFVIATIGHPLLYLLAIAVGTVVSTMIMAKLKKNLPEYDKK
ncbi:MAG: fructose-specific PTS transporter subunit EIIC [Clostridia bacterium]|jgi:PTS system, fru family, IIC component|nr:fructose-specific PTS transporter subunit EIIC [Clostridium sp.]MEE1380324.1 fructose-specific PTS transporter subunit EIIC [Clostridia bacterium]CDE56457.1 pTS system fructose-specific EIIBC component [Clostridium sp. CAG:269]